MNKRIRKKQLKRAVRGLIAACEEYEAARDRIFLKAQQELLDARGKSHEESVAALRRYLEVASYLASTGPLPRSLREQAASHTAA